MALKTLCLAVCISVGYSKAPKSIINGQSAYEGEFPYQVSLQNGYNHFCGGSIIDSTHILTAAHCVYTDNYEIIGAEEILVITGIVDTDARRLDNVFAVAEVTRHNDYIPRVRTTPDIAVLRLTTSITFNDYQYPINLASSYTPPDVWVRVSGWGVAYWSEAQSQTVRFLQKLDMLVVDLNKCATRHPYEISVGHICALGAPGAAACKGDSGGPVVYGNELVGIVSFGKPCAINDVPDVFTSVFYHVGWIQWTRYYH